MNIKIDFSLKRYNTFGLDVRADNFVEFDSVESVRQIFKYIGDKAWYVLGGGSNTLFKSNYRGVVLHSIGKDISVIEQDDESVLVRAEAGVVWDDFVGWCVDNGFFGVENLSYIPGTVGASAVQNIGAYGVEVKNVVDSVEVYVPSEDKVVILTNPECEFGYRDSIFKHSMKGDSVVVSLNFRLHKLFTPNISYGNVAEMCKGGSEVTAKSVRQHIIAIRREKLPDPELLGNCGSFFKNPVVAQDVADRIMLDYPNMPFYNDVKGVKIPAGWLIEQCGFKQMSKGKVAVYEKQALVIVNLGGAKSQDIIKFSNEIIECIKSKFGVEIAPEVVFV